MKRFSERVTRQSGILTVGVDASSPGPFHTGEPGAPDFAGFDVDLMWTIAERLELEPRFTSALWSTIIRQLMQGKLDVVCTAATITAERRKIVDFSSPYFDLTLVVVTRKDGPVRSFQDTQDKVIGVRIGTVAEEIARARCQARSILTYDFNDDAYKALEEGRLDAVIDDAPIARYFERLNPRLALAAEVEGTESQYGLMFAKGNDARRKAIDGVLEEIRSDGTYESFYRKWFGEYPQKGRSK